MGQLNMKTIIILLFSLFLVFSLGGCWIEREMESFARDGIIRTPDLSDLEDGDYTGRFRSGVVSVKLNVSVRDHRITAIEILKHFNGQGKKAEKITEEVIRRQSLEVEVVSGATYSSKVILKALEIALSGDS